MEPFVVAYQHQLRGIAAIIGARSNGRNGRNTPTMIRLDRDARYITLFTWLRKSEGRRRAKNRQEHSKNSLSLGITPDETATRRWIDRPRDHRVDPKLKTEFSKTANRCLTDA